MITTIDPATEEVIERFGYMDPADAGAKLQQAVTAFGRWRCVPLEVRSAALRSVAERFRAESASLAATAVREMGKPITQARAEIEKCAWALEYFAGNAAAMLAPQDAPSNASRSYVAFRPLGVVLAIMPWNFPYWQVVRAAAPALMAGNAMVLKHADNTTKCALEIERVFREAGAPEGLFGTLLMTNDAVDQLIGDARIAAVTLTGSERAGVAVASAAGYALKKSVLELGGSDAFVVLEDADLERAAKTAVTARFQNNGQSCIAAKRFIAVDSIYDEFLESRGEGLHHTKLYYADCAKAVADYERRGYKVIQSGKFDADEHYYLDTEKDFGYIIELGNGGRIRETDWRYPK